VSKLAALPPTRPSLEALPIPHDVAADASWCASMREMADHIGAYKTLILHDRFGGMQIYVPHKADGWYVADLIGAEAAETMCFVYLHGNLDLALGKSELWNARAAPFIASLRAKEISYSEAAWALHVTRPYLWNLVNRSQRAIGAKPLPKLRAVDPRQMELLGDIG
jgi:hypothetical protein